MNSNPLILVVASLLLRSQKAVNGKKRICAEYLTLRKYGVIIRNSGEIPEKISVIHK